MSVSYEVTGVVKKVGEVQAFGANGFEKAELWIEIDGDSKWPQMVSLEFTQDKTGLLSDVKEGQTVSATYNLQGREYNGRVYVSLRAWKLTIDAQGETAASQPEVDGFGDDEADSVPF